MNLKNFFIASLMIHIVGGIILYFYYNPIHFETRQPKPVGFFEGKTEENKPKTTAKETADQTAKEKKPQTQSLPAPSSQKISRKKTKRIKKEVSKSDIKNKKKTPNQARPKKRPKKLDSSQKQALTEIKEKPKTPTAEEGNTIDQTTALGASQEQALSKAKEPLTEIPTTSIETEELPLEIEDMEEIEETAGKDQKPLQTPTAEEGNTTDQTNTLDSSQEQALSEAKEPLTETPTASIETEEPPLEIDMEEIDMEEIEEATEKDQNPIKIAKAEKTENKPQSVREDIEKLEKTSSALEYKPLSQSKSQAGSSKKTTPRMFQTLKQKRGNPSLSYPDFARRNSMQGTVSVLFFVTEEGLTDQIQLASSSGHSELDNFVLRVLSRYEFLPGQKGWVKHDIPFKLEGEEIEHLRLREKE